MPYFLRLSALGLLVLPTAAIAAQPPMPNKWDTSSRSVIMHNDLPIICDDPAINAKNYLLSVEPAFTIAMSWQATVNPADQSTSTVAASQQGYGGTVAAGFTDFRYNSPYFWESYGTIVDADIYMNYDLLYWPGTTDVKKSYDLWCSSSYQGSFTIYNVDYQSAFLHEMGHVLGMDHRTDGATGPCVMHAQLPRGTTRWAFCADERTAYTGAY